MRYTKFVCLLFALSIAFSSNAQQYVAAVDTSQWQCKWCPGNEGVNETYVSGGAAYVTNDSYKFGDYRGLNENGPNILADAKYNARYQNNNYLEINAEDLGLDSRLLSIEGGKQGLAQLAVSYNEIPKLNEDSSSTPYSGNAEQGLPTSWIAGQNTGDMTALPDTLREVYLRTDRRNATIKATLYQMPSLSYDLNFRRESKKGRKNAGLGFGSFRSAILAIPIDYQSETASVGVNYYTKRWQITADYQFSAFKNEYDFIQWDNAFSTPTDTLQGQAATEPDNNLNQVSLSSSLRATDAILIAAFVSYGQMRQNETFLPYTINDTIASSTLPRASLDGKIDTLDASLSLTADVTDDAMLEFQYRLNEQDNDTARLSYDYIVADTSPSSTTRINLPYGFKRQNLRSELNYAINTQHKLFAGADFELFDRTFQDVETTREASMWGGYKGHISSLQLQFRLNHEIRDGNGYSTLTDLVSTQNSLMRKYYLADRNRSKANMSFSYQLFSTLDIGLNTSLAYEDYTNSLVGLQESTEASLTVDAHYSATKFLTLRALYAFNNVFSTQSGSSTFGEPDWQAENDDRIDLIDVGLVYELVANTIKVGFDFTYANSAGQITIDSGAFPELRTNRQTFTVYSDYQITRNALLKVAFLYERYEEDNWSKDGVAVNSLNNVLLLGDVSPYYDIGFATASFEYRF